MSGMTVLMRIDGGRRVGLGHLMRSFALADRLAADGDRAIFICHSNPQIYDLFARAPHRVYYMPPTARETTIAREISRIGLPECVDLVSIDIPADLTTAEMQAYCDCGRPVALFDDHGEAPRQASLTINAIAHPDHLDGAGRFANTYDGPAYIVLDDAYRRTPPAQFHVNARRLLVAMGGADPFNITCTALRALMPMAADADLHVLLGPAFGFRNEVENIAAAAPGAVTVESGIPPAGIPAYLAGFDLAVMSFGITVYGAAHLGVPCIVLGHDDAGARAGEVLERSVGCVRSLGHHDRVDPGTILRETTALLADAERRRTMVEKGKVAVDGESVDRICALFRSITNSRGR
jgi:spore coat polysaccharide biosynthesis predicted glycosyltransferase SpsG